MFFFVFMIAYYCYFSMVCFCFDYNRYIHRYKTIHYFCLYKISRIYYIQKRETHQQIYIKICLSFQNQNSKQQTKTCGWTFGFYNHNNGRSELVTRQSLVLDCIYRLVRTYTNNIERHWNTVDQTLR